MDPHPFTVAFYSPTPITCTYVLINTRSQENNQFKTKSVRLNQHLYRVMKVIPSPMCPCGEAEQNTEHFLQTCKLHLAQRQKIWDQPTPIKEKCMDFGGPTEDRQICCGDWHSSVKANDKKKLCENTCIYDNKKVFLKQFILVSL